VTLAAVLLAPYAGIHIITAPPPPVEAIDTTSVMEPHEAESELDISIQDEQPTPFSPSESLQEIEGLLAE